MPTASPFNGYVKMYDNSMVLNPIAYPANISPCYPPYTINNSFFIYNYSYSDAVFAVNASGSPLWIIYNGEPQGVWKTVQQNHSPVYPSTVECFKFKSGYSVRTFYVAGRIDFALYNPSGTMLGSTYLNLNSSEGLYAAFTVLQASDNTYRVGVVCFGNSSFVLNSIDDTFSLHAISDVEPLPEYHWKPFDTLKGKHYTIPLTMINEDKIGDYESPIVTTLRSDFDRISDAASLLPIFQNTPVGQMVTIAYSGDNWATMQAQRNPEQGTNDFLLDIKFRMALTESIIYTYTARIQLETYLQYPYLSFIVDDDNEVAVFDCVTYYESSASLQEPHWGYVGRSQSESEMHALWLWLQPSKNAEQPDNPYEDGTDDNGGEGGNPTPQTHLPLPSLPTEGGLDLGLFTVYNFDSTNKSMLNSIAAFLWSDSVLDNFKKYFNNFSDNILALYILPYSPANLPTKAFKVGRVTSDTITAAPYLTSRFVDIDMGSVNVKPRWTSYIDYSPYTKFELYLPGIGIESLDADDIMSPANSEGELVDQQGSVISLTYRVDLCTGFLVAYVFINDEMRYQYSGKVGMNVPITGENYNAMIQAFITGGSLVAGTLVKGGLSAPLTASLANGAASAVAGTVNAQKPDVYRSGNMGGDASMMACQNPYLIRHVPNKPKIEQQEVFTGFPSYKTGTLSEFDGYTECIEAHVEGISCTETERDMIIDLLKNGVIL